MTRETGDIVRLSVQSMLVIAGIVVTICMPIVGGLVSIKSDLSAFRATQEAQQRQIDRIETRVK